LRSDYRLAKTTECILFLGALTLCRFFLAVFFSSLFLPSGCSQPRSETKQKDAAADFQWKQPAIEVSTIKPREGKLDRSIVLSGKIEPRQATLVMAETAGLVVGRAFRDGAMLKKGDVLFRLDSSRQRLALKSAEVTLAAAQADLEWLEKDLQRRQELKKKGAIPSLEVDAARYQRDRAVFGVSKAQLGLDSAKRQLRDTTVRAPHNGIAHARTCDVGDHVAPGRPLLELVDLANVRIRIGVQGKEATFLRIGDSASLGIPELGGIQIQAELISIAPKANPRTGLFDTTWQSENPDQQILAGMIASLSLDKNPNRPTRLILPRQSVLRRNGNTSIFIVEGNVAREQRVQTGEQNEVDVEILKGVEKDNLVISTGIYSLSDGISIITRNAKPKPAQVSSSAKKPSLRPEPSGSK
jgi:RND family efflux transporter MFP subunit